MNNEQILHAILNAVNQGGALALRKQEGAKTVSDAGGGDLTTDSDKRVQDLMVEYLSAAMPGIEILSEEGENRTSLVIGERFIIDPIDGSYAYSRGGTDWGVTVAYCTQDGVDVGAIAQPKRNRLAWAVRGEGCWFQEGDGEARRVQLSQKIYEVGSEVIYMPVTNSFSDEVIREVQPAIIEQVRFVVNNVSNAGSIMDILTGYLDGMIAWAKLWDFAAGKLMVEEAGGWVGDFWGEPMDMAVIAPQRVMMTRSCEMSGALLPFTSKWPKEGDLRK